MNDINHHEPAADPHEVLTGLLDRAVPDALPVLQRQLDVVTDHLREAIADYEALRRIEDAGEPGVFERAGAHRLIAADRWQAALGARAALEAVYQDLAGRPSPQHAAHARVLGDLRLAPNPVGLGG